MQTGSNWNEAFLIPLVWQTESSEGEENRTDLHNDDDRDGDSYYCVGADLETLLVLDVEVPHQTCGGLETAVVFLCHKGANQGEI